MKIHLVWFIVLYMGSGLAQSQIRLSGRIVNSRTAEPISGANIFINNTTIGTASDSTGFFTITGLPNEPMIAVVSHVSFTNVVLKINRSQLNFVIELTPVLVELLEVDISVAEDKKWQKQYNRFKKQFLGLTENATECAIKNPWIINFEVDEKGFLLASAADLMIIENLATGYVVKFLLGHFKSKGDFVSYSGKQKFEPMVSDNPASVEKWTTLRRITYLGSRRHFFKSLVEDKLEDQGFHLYIVDLDLSNRMFKSIGANLVDRNACYKDNHFKTRKYLKVVYAAQASNDMYSGQNMEERINQYNASARNQISYLHCSEPTKLDSNTGNPEHPENIKEYGYWASRRIAELLPLEYGIN